MEKTRDSVPNVPNAPPTKAGGPKPPIRQPSTEWWDAFLSTLRDTGNISKSCAAVTVDRRTYRRHLKQFPVFARRVADAKADAADALAAVARERAIQSSDKLLIFLLKSLDPQTYGDRLRLTKDPREMSDEELEQWATL